MRILARYVFREFAAPLFYCLAGFVSIYLLFELFGSFSRLAEARPDWQTVAMYFAGYLAPYFEWLAPACLMLATLYTMWNFCRKSELTAMRASGIGFFAIVKPLLFVAALMAVFVGYVNEVFVPAKAQWAKQFRAARFKDEGMALADNVVCRNAAADRTWNAGILAAEDASALEDVSVSVDWPGGGRKMTVKADRAEYLDGMWWFVRPVVFRFDQHGAELPSDTPELDKLAFRCFPEFTETPRDFLLQNRDWAFCSVADRLRYIKDHPSLTREKRAEYTYDVWSQAVAPLACLVITLFAIPAGVATGRQSVFKGILGALGMFFAFYALTILCMVGARKGWLPPVPAALLPDIVFLAIGGVLFYRQR